MYDRYQANTVKNWSTVNQNNLNHLEKIHHYSKRKIVENCQTWGRIRYSPIHEFIELWAQLKIKTDFSVSFFRWVNIIIISGLFCNQVLLFTFGHFNNGLGAAWRTQPRVKVMEKRALCYLESGSSLRNLLPASTPKPGPAISLLFYALTYKFPDFTGAESHYLSQKSKFTAPSQIKFFEEECFN